MREPWGCWCQGLCPIKVWVRQSKARTRPLLSTIQSRGRGATGLPTPVNLYSTCELSCLVTRAPVLAVLVPRTLDGHEDVGFCIHPNKHLQQLRRMHTSNCRRSYR